jgi:Bacteriophage holin family, superfamily II-like
MKEHPVQQETQATVDATLAAMGSKATYTGASASVLSWMVSSEFGVILGLFLGVGGFAINWYYRHKEDKRQQLEHERRMRDE